MHKQLVYWNYNSPGNFIGLIIAGNVNVVDSGHRYPDRQDNAQYSVRLFIEGPGKNFEATGNGHGLGYRAAWLDEVLN